MFILKLQDRKGNELKQGDIVKMRAENLEVEVQEFNENNVDYVVSCRTVQPDA